MRTLLIGDMKRIEGLYHWLDVSTECFEVELILSENEFTSLHYTCPIKPLTAIETVKTEYEIVFICSNRYKEIKDILVLLGMDANLILIESQICSFLSKENAMNYYSKQFYDWYQSQYISDNIKVGEFTYGIPTIFDYGDGTRLTIGKFCSIAPNATIILGGEHRSDWCTTYPFNSFMNDFDFIKGNPTSKGDVVIGNDVWMARDCRILSGVHIGDGCVIATNALVTKDVEPYSIVGGVPAKVIRKRFDEETIQKLEEMQWWDWDKEQIYDAIPLLQSNAVDKLYEYYNVIVKNKKERGN